MDDLDQRRSILAGKLFVSLTVVSTPPSFPCAIDYGRGHGTEDLGSPFSPYPCGEGTVRLPT